MSLASRITAKRRRPTATVRLNGRLWRNVLTLSREQAFGQGVSGGTVEGRDPPVTIVEGETRISWTWGYDGFERAGFEGIVTKILTKSYPNRWTLQVADPLWLADIRRGDIATSPLNDIAASEAVEQILSGAGLSRLSIPTLPASGSAWAGSEWRLGQLTPVSFANTSRLTAAQAICETLGFWLYCDASGTVRATLIERRPSGSPSRTLVWGEDFLLAGPPDRERDAASVRNRVVVRGANTGVQGAQIFDVWQTGAADRTLEVNFPLIEYVNESQAGNASATAVAKRLIRLHSRQPNVIKIPRLKADPRLAVGQTVAIECPPIGFTVATPFFIYALSTTLDLRRGDFSQALTLDGGTGSQGYTTVPPPLASFTWRLVKETLNGTGVTELFLDGTGSQSATGGEITAWSWSTATTTALSTPTTATGSKAMFVYPAATATASVTLTVTDTNSKQSSVTLSITLAGDELVTPTERLLHLALGAAWAASDDGGATWNVVTANADATLVPELGEGTLIATRASGSTGLRSSRDALATAPTNRASLGATITALAQTVGAPDRVWAATGVTLRLSTDGGATFSTWGTLPATITAIVEDPAVPFSVFVLAGNTLYQSISPTAPGTAWTPLYVGPTGATARHLVRDTGQVTWICYTGSFTGSPLQRVEGPITAAFPVVSPAVSEIRAIAMPPDESVVYAWDQEGRGWVVSSATGIATQLTGAALAAGETAQHAIHDPDDSIVYLATFGTTQGTTYKYFPLLDELLSFYVPASGQQAHRVGLSLTGPPLAPTVVYSLVTGSVAVDLGEFGVPPEGWQTVDFDDSAWVAASVSSFDLGIVGATTICGPGGATATNNDVHLTRQTFSLAVGDVERARITACIDNSGEIYLNGALLGEIGPLIPPTTQTVIEVSPALLIAGGDNVIAARMQNLPGPASPVGVEYMLEINYVE